MQRVTQHNATLLSASRQQLAFAGSLQAAVQARWRRQAPAEPPTPFAASHIECVAHGEEDLHPFRLSQLPHRCVAAGAGQQCSGGGHRWLANSTEGCEACQQPVPATAHGYAVAGASISTPSMPQLQPTTHRCLAYGSVSDSKHSRVTPHSCTSGAWGQARHATLDMWLVAAAQQTKPPRQQMFGLWQLMRMPPASRQSSHEQLGQQLRPPQAPLNPRHESNYTKYQPIRLPPHPQHPGQHN